MKKIFYLFVCLAVWLFGCLFSYGQSGIGTTTPNASAVLDISSTTKGLLMPRMTEAQRNAIASPSSGLMIYNTTTNCVNFYKNGVWETSCISRTPPSLTIAHVGRCDAGYITGNATTSSGCVIDWYTTPTGGQPFHVSNSYTVWCSTTQSFYVSARNTTTGQQSARVRVEFQVVNTPAMPPVATITGSGGSRGWSSSVRVNWTSEYYTYTGSEPTSWGSLWAYSWSGCSPNCNPTILIFMRYKADHHSGTCWSPTRRQVY